MDDDDWGRCAETHPDEGVRCERALGHQHAWHIHGINTPGRGITVWGHDPHLRGRT